MSEGVPEEVLVSAVGACIKKIIQEAIHIKRSDGIDLRSEYIQDVPEYNVTIGQKLLNTFKQSAPPIIDASEKLEHIFGAERVLTVMRKNELPVISIRGTAAELADVIGRNEEWRLRLQGAIGNARGSSRNA